MALNVKPAFQAEYVEGAFKRTVIDIVEDVKVVNGHNGERKIITRKLVPKVETFPAGYMLYFPQGHSIFVAADDKPQLERLGVLDVAPRVDMESGEEVPDDFHLSPKEIVQRKTQNRPRPPGEGTLVVEGDTAHA